MHQRKCSESTAAGLLKAFSHLRVERKAAQTNTTFLFPFDWKSQPVWHFWIQTPLLLQQ